MGQAHAKAAPTTSRRRRQKNDVDEYAEDEEEEEEEEEEGKTTASRERGTEKGSAFDDDDDDDDDGDDEGDDEEEEEFSEPAEARIVARCERMCPAREHARRKSASDFHAQFEASDGGKMLKKFSRTFDGNPDEVRTLDAIETSLERLVTVIEETIGSTSEGEGDACCSSTSTSEEKSETMFHALASLVWDRSRAIRGDVTAQSASGPKARRIMRRVVQTLIRFDYEIQKRQRARKYAYFMRGDQIEEDVTMKRRMHEEDSMARMFREQLGKSLATYSTMCAERARYVSTEEKAEVLAYRLLLRLSAKIEDSTFSSSSFSSSPSSSKLDNIDFRAAEPDVLSSQLVLRAMRVSVCGDTGKYVSFFRAVSSESFTFEEFCCVYACLDPLRVRYLLRSNISHNRMKMKKDDACSLLKLERVEKLHLLLLQARTDFDDIDIAFRAGGLDESDVVARRKVLKPIIASANITSESVLPASGAAAFRSWKSVLW